MASTRVIYCSADAERLSSIAIVSERILSICESVSPRFNRGDEYLVDLNLQGRPCPRPSIPLS
jgi:hypothetical protein